MGGPPLHYMLHFLESFKLGSVCLLITIVPQAYYICHIPGSIFSLPPFPSIIDRFLFRLYDGHDIGYLLIFIST